MVGTAVAAVGSALPSPVHTRPGRLLQVGSLMPEDGDSRPLYVGSRIAEIIDYQGLRPVWVAEQMGYHRTYFNRVLRGEKPISDEFVRRAVAFFHLPADMLFTRQTDDE